MTVKSFSRLEDERKPEEEPVVRDVEGDPDEDDHRRAAAELLRDELAERAARLLCHGQLVRGDGTARDLLEDLRRFAPASVAGEPVGALREVEPREEGEEGGEGGGEEEVAPAGVAADLVEEDPRQSGREEQADGPEEVQEDEEAAAVLRREVLREHGGVDDEERAETDACEEAEGRDRPGPPREGGQRGEARVPEDRGHEDAPAADPVGEPAEDDAADERAGERRGGDPAGQAARDPPESREDRNGEADEQNLHRHEGPREAGDRDRAAVEPGEAAAAKDVLDVRASGDGGCWCLDDCHLR